MNLTEKTVEKHTLYKGFIINLRVDDALLPDGRPCKREMVEHPGGAAVLCVEDGKVLLVRQFRYAYGEELLEIPAGKLDKGEDPAHAAARELEEETGRVADAWKSCSPSIRRPATRMKNCTFFWRTAYIWGMSTPTTTNSSALSASRLQTFPR